MEVMKFWVGALALAAGLSLLVLTAFPCELLAQTGVGKQFGSRDPRTCTSRKEPVKGSPTAAQLQQYFICDQEVVRRSATSGDLLYLVTDVKLEVGKGRPFSLATDAVENIDPAQTVYPVRGTYAWWQCSAIGSINGQPGKNCVKDEMTEASGRCYKSTFGEWHCLMFGGGPHDSTRYPPPAGQ